MELKLSEADAAFRQEVRNFVEAKLPPEIRRKVELGLRLGKDDYVIWQKILHEKGWIAPAWPKEQGGTGWTPVQRYIFEEELALGATPPIIAFGLHMVGPVLLAFGSQAQKERYLPHILACEDWWCQGYS